ncbi:MAG TPA: alpha/beta hydrolase [Noviherbaspirillum sp.]|uniref:esterase/lipase family protein n=1 Tax=Noviherbaspirillum sp. TaxID=1926288 RepID=UPI002D7081F3|nr:alpha/beta hydrolase [Noviherbaspirillum sp.]HYD94671.1 alpha/beta hydrolase [Noviherbaspirillum sp.]
MNIVYIHGNQASSESFNFIRAHMTGHNPLFLEYNGEHGFYCNHQRMREQLAGVDDIFFVAHSLGGIHALHLANELPDKVAGAVTISTPYGGSKAAEVIQYLLPLSQLVKDIQPSSAPIVEGNRFKVVHPWTNIVTTKGHSPLMTLPNDGVVTHASMRYRKDITLVDVPRNHYEILLSHEAVAIIKNAIEGIGSTVCRKSIACA